MHFRRPLSRKATAIDSLGRKSQVLGFSRMQVAGRRQERAVVLRQLRRLDPKPSKKRRSNGCKVAASGRSHLKRT